jgi:hypothetical protein
MDRVWPRSCIRRRYRLAQRTVARQAGAIEGVFILGDVEIDLGLALPTAGLQEQRQRYDRPAKGYPPQRSSRHRLTSRPLIQPTGV